MNGKLCFFLDKNQSPTHFNLSHFLLERGWRSGSFKWQAHFSEANLQFNQKAAEQLEYKHHLAVLAAHFCPEAMPLTYCVNDSNWPFVLNQMAAQHYLKQDGLNDQIRDLVWILKPALLNNGESIKVFTRLSELERHFLSANRLGGEHVLQQYITHPHLLRAAHKYSIRLFVVLTNYAGNFLYPKGYFNVALQPFTANEYQDLRGHLTNEHLLHTEANVIQIPSSEFAQFQTLVPQIQMILSDMMKGLTQWHPEAFHGGKTKKIALFGFDFMVDASNRVWLLEANHGPCFPIEANHPLQKHVYQDFWQHLIRCFIEPIANRQALETGHYSPFEWIPD
ncbi:MAG: tubulin-tyrosine ligase [Tatlockia sp.]|jgi:tubulin--tyrosine ligase